MGAQSHFYFEPQVSLAEPGEDGEMTVYASTQNPSETQFKVAEVLGVPANKVVVRTKRMGGGFGGKETRSFYVSAACALAAAQLKRPVRMVLDRDVDMATAGTRHAAQARYRVGFDDNGVVQGVEVDFYVNGGYSIDLSFSVLDRGLFHLLNTYRCNDVRFIGRVCKTNTLTATAYRGFGGPQGMLVCETWMDHIARELKIPVETVRDRNFLRAGDRTHYNQPLDPTVRVAELFRSLRASSEFDKRRAAIDAFNASSRYRKRGIALLPTIFGLSFTAKFLNQAGALVNAFIDGSVQVNIAGTEMGQGLFTKMAQIAANALGVSVENVRVMETATDKVMILKHKIFLLRYQLPFFSLPLS